ncbi:MAG: hypothetical protein FD170_3326 [Bacteroidetes bacterium]|nr:MAG: hypothetical protein FD170_3326 [Bacteroidota bacterium]
MFNITFAFTTNWTHLGILAKRMKNQRSITRIGKIAILATAFLVFWIYLGSLINFHQHHIFGRTLIPAGILSKREETLIVSNDLPSLDYFQAQNVCIQELEIALKLQFSEISLPDYCPLAVIVIGIPADHGLRAPPLVS